MQTQSLRPQNNKQKRCFDPIHRRLLQIPHQHRDLAQKLTKVATAIFTQLYPNQLADNYFLQNLTCRMLQNNKFKEQESHEAIVFYLTYLKKLKQKYTWQSFKTQRQMNVFNYLGKDKKDRPVVLISVKNAHLSSINDRDKFVDFQFYFFGVYLQSKMEGWVDQCDAIFDASGHSNDNTKFSKTIVLQAYKLFFGQTKHIIGINIGLFTKTLITLLFPILPQQFVKSIALFGKQKQQIHKRLRQSMHDDIIPDFLGGTNNSYLQHPEYSVVDLQFPSSLSSYPS